MSRSGYSDDCEQWALIRWRGAVNSAIKGTRGQKLLREMADALDAMPVKELIAEELQTESGEFCALGVVGAARGLDMKNLDPEDREGVAKAFGIAPALAAEIVYVNDEHVDEWRWVEVEICGPMRAHWERTTSVRVPNEGAGAQRWREVRAWVAEQLTKATS